MCLAWCWVPSTLSGQVPSTLSGQCLPQCGQAATAIPTWQLRRLKLTCWWTGKPGVLQSVGSQRVSRDWVTELNWTRKDRHLGPAPFVLSVDRSCLTHREGDPELVWDTARERTRLPDFSSLKYKCLWVSSRSQESVVRRQLYRVVSGWQLDWEIYWLVTIPASQREVQTRSLASARTQLVSDQECAIPDGGLGPQERWGPPEHRWCQKSAPSVGGRGGGT